MNPQRCPGTNSQTCEYVALYGKWNFAYCGNRSSSRETYLVLSEKTIVDYLARPIVNTDLYKRRARMSEQKRDLKTVVNLLLLKTEKGPQSKNASGTCKLEKTQIPYPHSLQKGDSLVNTLVLAKKFEENGEIMKCF